MGKRFLTRRQVRARYGGIADITVRRWIDAGWLDEPLRIGNRDYFDEEKLDATDSRRAAAARARKDHIATEHD